MKRQSKDILFSPACQVMLIKNPPDRNQTGGGQAGRRGQVI